jgi:hypothetical protein
MAEAPIYESPTPYEQSRIHAAGHLLQRRPGGRADRRVPAQRPRIAALRPGGGAGRPAPASRATWLTFQEARGVEDALRFLIRVHDLHQIVLIAHEGCAYYRDRLGVPDASLLTEQRQDLEKAHPRRAQVPGRPEGRGIPGPHGERPDPLRAAVDPGGAPSCRSSGSSARVCR